MISYGDESARKSITLSPPEENSFYEIYASNNCSRSQTESDRLLTDARAEFRLSDFQFFYNLIDVHAVDRFDLGISTGGGSPNFPCDLIRLGQHSDLP
jgi:hypothetical protein